MLIIGRQKLKPYILHNDNTIIQVIWLQTYSEKSFMDKGTLKQLENLINRTNIPKLVKNNYAAVRNFFSVVFEAHVIVAGMQFFGMKKVSDAPTKNVPPESLTSASSVERKDYIKSAIGKFVDTFALGFINNEVNDLDVAADDPQLDEDDGVNNYALAIIGYGLLANNFEDAYKEGDGERLLRLWKFFLLHFKANGRSKYSVEAFHLIAQTNALLTARKAHQLIWNRTCSTRHHGENKPLDLQNEHLNRNLKDDINTFRAHITQRSIDRTGHAIGPTMHVLENFDKETLVKPASGKHVEPQQKEELDIIVKELRKLEVFAFKSGRKHRSFPKFPADPLYKLKEDKPKLHKWLRDRRKQIAIDQAIQTMKF